MSSTAAVVWARSSEPAEMVVTYGPEGETARGESTAAADFTARVELEGLEPGTLYPYSVRFEKNGESSSAVEGSFRTAPAPEASAPVRFVVAGDLGGHGFCREEEVGYAVFSRMRELEPHFFVANVDMIYADSTCPVERPGGGRNVPGEFPAIDDPAIDWADEAAAREVFLAHWRYNRADPHFQDFLRNVPMYVQWDDHEVINDFGAAWPSWTAAIERSGFPTLVRAGRSALFDFHPLKRHPGEPDRIYRSFRWGRDVELFLLDARSYRSLNDLSDRPDNEKTLLGRAQLDWLKSGLAASEATWKIVSTDVPLSIPTGSSPDLYGRDAFADGTASGYSSRTGFERELRELLTHLDASDVRNLVFVATDVHFATTLRYEVDVDGDGDALSFHELVSGPLSAVPLHPQTPDPTFEPRILYAEGDFFNFSFVVIERGDDGVSRLTADVRDEEGRPRFGSRLVLDAR